MCVLHMRKSLIRSFSTLLLLAVASSAALQPSAIQNESSHLAEGTSASQGPALALPEVAAAEEGGPRTLSVGGKIALHGLGPAIVAEDGTLRRITNWASLSQQEKVVALRRIAQRNQARLEVLKREQEASGHGTAAQLQARLEATAQNIRAAQEELQEESSQEAGVTSSATDTSSTSSSSTTPGTTSADNDSDQVQATDQVQEGRQHIEL